MKANFLIQEYNYSENSCVHQSLNNTQETVVFLMDWIKSSYEEQILSFLENPERIDTKGEFMVFINYLLKSGIANRLFDRGGLELKIFKAQDSLISEMEYKEIMDLILNNYIFRF